MIARTGLHVSKTNKDPLVAAAQHRTFHQTGIHQSGTPWSTAMRAMRVKFQAQADLAFLGNHHKFLIYLFCFFWNNPPHISGFFGCRRTTPASKYLGHPLTSARWQDYVSTSVPRAAEEDCSRDRFSARKLPKNIEEGGWRTEKSPIKWALKWENHPTKWRIFRQAMFDYQKVTLRFNDEFTGNHVFYC